jgi:glycosyltransferase involved in cell wall biosynthesis
MGQNFQPGDACPRVVMKIHKPFVFRAQLPQKLKVNPVGFDKLPHHDERIVCVARKAPLGGGGKDESAAFPINQERIQGIKRSYSVHQGQYGYLVHINLPLYNYREMNLASTPRIAVFTKQLDAWRSGSGHQLNEIMKRVLDQNEERGRGKIDFTFLHYKPSDNDIYRRVREVIVPRNPLRFALVLRREKFDLVHYTPLTIYSPIWLVPNKKTATIHGVEQLLLPEFFGPVEMFHERFLVPIFARRMDGILTVSNSTKAYMVKNFRVKEDRVTVAYNGVGPEYHPRDPASLRAPARYGVRPPYVFHISRFSERKNPWTLLSAFQRFSLGAGKDHLLVCAGKGWDDEAVVMRARELGIQDRLFCPGFISETDAAEFFCGADFFVFPTLAEGFGIPNAEAMASGCPVITTTGFAVSEVVADAAIVLEDPRDAVALAAAMERLSGDEELRQRLVRRGLRRVKIFSWEEGAKKLLAMYDRILGLAPCLH